MKTTRPTNTPAVPTTPKPAATAAAEVKSTAPTASGAAPNPSSFNSAAASRGADLDGSSAGYVSPTAVPSPFTNDEKAALSKKIPCPALAGMFQAGMLKVEKDGTVKIPDLERALSQLGPDAITRKVLTDGGDKSDGVKDGQFNLFKLNGSNLDHTGSSGIRQNGTHPERFDKLMSFSKDGQTLTRKDLADAADAFAKEDPGVRGRVTQLAEMSIVLNVFGRRAPDGSRYFTKDDAKSLFLDGKIPSSWSPPAVPGKVGLGDVLSGTALGIFRQIFNRQ
ncbi:MAG: hypothetical protein JNM17_16175 [Archangium sp.]|nr:hypothetical protein [Archangium sp.]